MLCSSETQPRPQVHLATIKFLAVLLRRKRWSEDLLTSFFGFLHLQQVALSLFRFHRNTLRPKHRSILKPGSGISYMYRTMYMPPMYFKVLLTPSNPSPLLANRYISFPSSHVALPASTKPNAPVEKTAVPVHSTAYVVFFVFSLQPVPPTIARRWALTSIPGSPDSLLAYLA